MGLILGREVRLNRLYNALAEAMNGEIVANGLAAEMAGLGRAEAERRMGDCLLLCADLAGAADLAATLIRSGVAASTAWRIASAGLLDAESRTAGGTANDRDTL